MWHKYYLRSITPMQWLLDLNQSVQDICFDMQHSTFNLISVVFCLCLGPELTIWQFNMTLLISALAENRLITVITWHILEYFVLALQAWMGRSSSHSHALKHAIWNRNVWYVARLTYYTECFHISWWFFRFLPYR